MKIRLADTVLIVREVDVSTTCPECAADLTTRAAVVCRYPFDSLDLDGTDQPLEVVCARCDKPLVAGRIYLASSPASPAPLQSYHVKTREMIASVRTVTAASPKDALDVVERGGGTLLRTDLVEVLPRGQRGYWAVLDEDETQVLLAE